MENMGRIALCSNSFYFLKMFNLDLCHFSEIKLLLDINNGKNVSQRLIKYFKIIKFFNLLDSNFLLMNDSVRRVNS